MHDTRPPAPPVLTPLIPSRVLTPCPPLRHAVLTPLIPSPFGRGETQSDRRSPSPEGRGGQGVRTMDGRDRGSAVYALYLPALREPADVTLGAALGERELRAAVGAGADEVLPFPGALAHHRFRPGGAHRRRRDRAGQ